MATLIPPIPNQPVSNTHEWRDWFFNVGQNINTGGIVRWDNIVFDGSSITSIVNRQHNSLQGLQGGATSGTEYYHVTSSQYSLINNQPFIEVVDSSATIGLSTTPILLKPATTVTSTDIGYDSSTGVFTFNTAGIYTLTVAVNAAASTSSQLVYIWAENNTGSGWVVNTNSGKQYSLINNDPSQLSVSIPTRRTAGQQVRYWISATSSNVRLQTDTIPTTTAIVPAIRIQYAGIN